MIPGETILSGGESACPDCKTVFEFEVMKTCAWFVGTQCKCGANSRETDYFKTKEEAEKVLQEFGLGNFKSARY